ncbi:kelch-like protein 26 [Clavelina lepadiformis]|uniref:kelch-like protein 26 n=1 Tax=Clavelina lepadiformis TaxID=159417 RepID=UPI00404363E2
MKVDLSKISSEVLEEDMSNETLICDNFNCLKLLHKEVTQRSKLLREGSRSSIYSLGGSKNLTEVFNVSGSTKKTFSNLPLKTSACCGAVLHESLVYLIGGCVESKNKSITNQVYCFDMKKDMAQWNKVASMKVHRQVMGAAVLNGKIFVVGGANKTCGQLSSGEYYSSAFNSWTNISPMKQERSGNAVVACRGFVYSLGGVNTTNYLNSVERYYPKNDVWDDVPSMKVPRRWFAAVALNDTHIYAIGGQTPDKTETRQKSVERYDVTTNKWDDVSEMNVERRAHAACVLQGKIYVIGGLGKHNLALKSIECYDPATDKWTIVGETQDGLFHHALVVI